jgi:hypothetical protein
MKTIVLYGLQMLVGLVALAAGYAKLTGMGFIAEPLAMIGLGQTFLILAGSAEILAGLCLLFPSSGVIGVLLLASVMVATMGATVGHAVTHRAADQSISPATFRTSAPADGMVRPAVVIKKSQGWDI